MWSALPCLPRGFTASTPKVARVVIDRFSRFDSLSPLTGTHERQWLTNHPDTAVFGPAATTWFKFLAKNVNFKSNNATIAARVALDQGVFAPCAIAVFLSSMAVLEGGSVSDKLQKSYTDALSTNYMVWPAAQAVNFKMVPLEHRVLFVNVISIGWNCYLSFINSS